MSVVVWLILLLFPIKPGSDWLTYSVVTLFIGSLTISLTGELVPFAGDGVKRGFLFPPRAPGLSASVRLGVCMVGELSESLVNESSLTSFPVLHGCSTWSCLLLFVPYFFFSPSADLVTGALNHAPYCTVSLLVLAAEQP
ncbi:hypothetical protein I3843_09G128600 [Carya illinoinensis]|nr:hypothetical protein I3843_09G128600 [Carya illinoinensis]